MSSNVKKAAAILLALVAVIAVIFSGYKNLGPQAQNKDADALQEYVLKASPAELERLNPRQREIILKERKRLQDEGVGKN